MKSWVVLSVAICAEVIATSAMKASDGFTRPLPAVVTVMGYGVAFYFLSLALRTISVGVAYALWSGIGIVLIALIGWLAFGQRIDGWGMVGMGLIIAGVMVLNFLSRSAAH